MLTNPKSGSRHTKEKPKIQVLAKWLNFIRKKADNTIKSHMWIANLRYKNKEKFL